MSAITPLYTIIDSKQVIPPLHRPNFFCVLEIYHGRGRKNRYCRLSTDAWCHPDAQGCIQWVEQLHCFGGTAWDPVTPSEIIKYGADLEACSFPWLRIGPPLTTRVQLLFEDKPDAVGTLPTRLEIGRERGATGKKQDRYTTIRAEAAGRTCALRKLTGSTVEYLPLNTSHSVIYN